MLSCYLNKILFIASRYEHVNKIDGLFQGVSDRFQGITVDSIVECCDVTESFDTTLASKFRVIMMHSSK